jgi:FkbM family methyltransferase
MIENSKNIDAKPKKKTIEQLMGEKKLQLEEKDDKYIIISEDRQIWIALNQKIYIKTIMWFFDYYFHSVDYEIIDGKKIVNFSVSKKHKIKGFDQFDVFCPSVAEPFETIQQYLDFADLKSKDIVIDLGAYSGLTSIAFSQAVGKEGKVIALEPDIFNYECAEKNILNDTLFNNISLLNVAVWKESGFLEFSTEQNMGSSATAVVGNRGLVKKIPCMTLSDIANHFNLEKIDFIKCDVEGAEAFIFEDYEFFQKYKPKIIIETHIVNGSFCDDICIDRLTNYGYNYFRINQKGLEMPLLGFQI